MSVTVSANGRQEQAQAATGQPLVSQQPSVPGYHPLYSVVPQSPLQPVKFVFNFLNCDKFLIYTWCCSAKFYLYFYFAFLRYSLSYSIPFLL